MDTKLEALRQVPLFAGLQKGELLRVAQLADELVVPAGTSLTIEGETGREFFVLLEGVASVEVDGRVVRMLVGGDFLGEIALLTRTPRTATVTAVVPVRLLVLTDRAFRQIADWIPSVASQTWAATAERLH
jgi:CRP/FNR family transcriptional regulator, cyclic AMP receptor protein